MTTDLLKQAMQFHQLNKLSEAGDLYEKVYASDPDNLELCYFYGILKYQIQDFSGARTLLMKLAKRVPDDVDVNYHLGLVLQALGESDEAARYYRVCLQKAPGHFQAMNSLGELARVSGNDEQAIEWYRKCLMANGQFIESAYNLFRVYHERGDYELVKDAVSCLERIDAGHFYTRQGQALLAMQQGEYGRAIELFGQLHMEKPQDKSILSSLVVAYQDSGQLDKAIKLAESFRDRTDTGSLDMLLLANMELCAGKFQSGWKDYLRRFDDRKNVEHISSITPEMLSGKRVLVQKEQGLGDELFFLRFLPYLKQVNARVSYLSTTRLCPLLTHCEVFDEIVGDDSGDYDFRLRVADLGHIFSIGVAGEFPPPVRLVPDEAMASKMRTDLLTQGQGPFIGLTWRAGVKARNKLFKSIPLDVLAAAMGDVDATFVSLQRLPLTGELEQLRTLSGKTILDYSHLNNDLEGMLALLSVLDDYVGVSNTNIHLRASLVMPARVLVPSPPEWRWMLSGKTSPWFPDFQIFRQATTGSWTEAVQCLFK